MCDQTCRGFHNSAPQVKCSIHFPQGNSVWKTTRGKNSRKVCGKNVCDFLTYRTDANLQVLINSECTFNYMIAAPCNHTDGSPPTIYQLGLWLSCSVKQLLVLFPLYPYRETLRVLTLLSQKRCEICFSNQFLGHM